jgi:misacylated tRNA(Ala) deacylase
MATEKYFYVQPYGREFEAEIVEIAPEGDRVAFDRSAFFPGGGGQPCDLGTLSIEGEDYAVTEVNMADGVIWHKLDRALHPGLVGRGVLAKLDWERRYAHMRYHSALHVLNGVAFLQYGALVTGGQVYGDRARIDLTMEDLAPAKVEVLERESNLAIARNLPLLPREVTSAEAATMPELVRTLNAMPPVSANGTTRVMEIEGLDRQFCGGTHLASTSEMGTLKITSTRSKGKLNKRIEIVLE